MTRINLLHPRELADQHLFSEFREIKMIPKALARSLRAAWQREFDKNDSNEFEAERVRLTIAAVLAKVPKDYTLGKGHVSFFYNKGQYLFERYEVLRQELRRRGIRFNEDAKLDPDDVFLNNPMFLAKYTPTPEAIVVIRTRIAEKIATKPSWYRWTNTLPPAWLNIYSAAC